MAGWDVSRHPEWDMMYAAGLTVREIADRCHQKRNTVHLHLQVRERHEPGTRARHETALAARDPDRPTTGWRRRLKEAHDFLSAHGMLPRNDADTQIERSLHTWIARQRRAYHRGELSPPKNSSLEASQVGPRPPDNSNSTSTGTRACHSSGSTSRLPGPCQDTVPTKPNTNTPWASGSTSNIKTGPGRNFTRGGSKPWTRPFRAGTARCEHGPRRIVVGRFTLKCIHVTEALVLPQTRCTHTRSRQKACSKSNFVEPGLWMW